MVIDSANSVRKQINRMGGLHQPFFFAIDFELRQGMFIPDPLWQQEVLFDIRGISNIQKQQHVLEHREFNSIPMAYADYVCKFEEAQRGLMRGDSFLLNLTIPTLVQSGWSLEEIFYRSQALYRLYVPGEFVCFSPERFVLIEDGLILSNPMKGTIDASIPGAAEVILADYKERAEHNTIVDLIRNDLNRVANDVQVRRFRYIDCLHTTNGDILQVSSEIVGHLEKDYFSHLGDILFKLLPAGSISGAPKQSTLAIITRAEQIPRGFYTGVFGYFDGQRLDSAVMIRFIEEREGQYYFRSGGGVTVNSCCRDEYQEVIQKVYLPFNCYK